MEVVAPIAWFDYAERRPRKPGIPLDRQDGPLRIHHPRWFYPPARGYTNATLWRPALIPFLKKLRPRYPFDVIDSHFAYPAGTTAALVGAALDCPFTITLRGNEVKPAQSHGMRRRMRSALRRAVGS